MNTGRGPVTEKSEHDITIDSLQAFVRRVSEGKPENVGVRAAESTLTSILGQMAIDGKREVTWDEMMKKRLSARGIVMRHFVGWAFAIALLSRWHRRVWHRNVTGTITGIVTDSSGGVPKRQGDRAKHRNGRDVYRHTDADGTFWLRNLPVGIYDVDHRGRRIPGFEAKDIRLQVMKPLVSMSE